MLLHTSYWLFFILNGHTCNLNLSACKVFKLFKTKNTKRFSLVRDGNVSVKTPELNLVIKCMLLLTKPSVV
ncbi:hypothetical protein QVD17_17063 [Tagetes erecta]|uniref:Secreted protein n=1 Tax=Tagetes erecta TaxID=13708 RepID=A0AAD8KRM7_TARER|nr:hypothetical protein QVD17_35368 [Tagetes erecta]KAK1428234.1 hypothetical protein QVD17_17063 [Tagetes erecta]